MTKTVREFSRFGPCITLGEFIKETPVYYVYRDRCTRKESRIRKPLPDHYSRAHVAPCRSCRDHEQTQYPEGYMD